MVWLLGHSLGCDALLVYCIISSWLRGLNSRLFATCALELYRLMGVGILWGWLNCVEAYY